MKNWTLKPAVKDHRGHITDILDDVPLNSISFVATKKGSVRGNHYHKKTIQYIYMLKGRIKYFSRKGKGKVRSVALKPGDLVVSPPMESHTVVTLTDCEFLALSHGPRHGGNFEADTYRLKEPLVVPPRAR